MFSVLTERKSREHHCKEVNDTVYCSRTTVIQDYLPRNYYFSFGFNCHSIGSLKGVRYNMSISEQTNTTKCSTITFKTPCSKYYSQYSLPNLQGQFHEDIKYYYDLQSWIYLLGDKFKEPCYQYLEECICYLYFPKCEDETLIPVCRETCADFVNACVEKWLSVLKGVSASEIKLQIFKRKVENRSIEELWLPLCNYMPPKDGSVPCFHKPVTCEDPPIVTNSVVQSETVAGKKTLFIQFQTLLLL